jgi:hypothetical protein
MNGESMKLSTLSKTLGASLEIISLMISIVASVAKIIMNKTARRRPTKSISNLTDLDRISLTNKIIATAIIDMEIIIITRAIIINMEGKDTFRTSNISNNNSRSQITMSESEMIREHKIK